MPLDFIGDKPTGLIISLISSTLNFTMSYGLSAFLKRIGVILFTPASVLCADNSTAISKVYGSLWSNGISILGNKSSKTFIIKLIFSDLFIMLKFTHKIYINEYIENRR